MYSHKPYACFYDTVIKNWSLHNLVLNSQYITLVSKMLDVGISRVGSKCWLGMVGFGGFCYRLRPFAPPSFQRYRHLP